MDPHVSPPDSLLALQWVALLEQTPAPALQLLAELADREAAALAGVFYDTMLQDPQARVFLDHDVVNSRLRASMQRWVHALLSGRGEPAVAELIALQKHVGTVHARINVRVDLVLRGARLIKDAIGQHLLGPAGADSMHVHAHRCAAALVDMAIEVMSAQYVSSHELAARSEEGYRTFAASMNMSLERERQRTALLDWESRFLQEVMLPRGDDPLAPLAQSSFGLWIHHKATAIFTHGSELARIQELMARIDTTLLPLCSREALVPGSTELRRLVRAVLAEVAQIRYLKDALFDHLVDLEAGRDALTQLLNRRYLPAILKREIDLSRQSGKPFALLLIDVDHFKAINDEHGHDAGDRVLQQLSGILANAIRSGDFVFRFGGEEFLIVCVELSAAQALGVAEKIRRAVAADTFLLANGHSIGVTISVGVAIHDGHPDYQRLIDRADAALYRAKHAGRDRCVLSDQADPA